MQCAASTMVNQVFGPFCLTSLTSPLVNELCISVWHGLLYRDYGRIRRPDGKSYGNRDRSGPSRKGTHGRHPMAADHGQQYGRGNHVPLSGRSYCSECRCNSSASVMARCARAGRSSSTAADSDPGCRRNAAGNPPSSVQFCGAVFMPCRVYRLQRGARPGYRSSACRGAQQG